jgi:hypothetical protein
MLAHKVEDSTISELLSLYKERASEKYYDYCKAIKGTDEDLKDKSYREWAYVDDCLSTLNKVLRMLRSDNM